MQMEIDKVMVLKFSSTPCIGGQKMMKPEEKCGDTKETMKTINEMESESLFNITGKSTKGSGLQTRHDIN